MSNTTTIEVQPADLLKVLASVHTSASKDDMLPLLSAVHVFHSAGQLVAEATDRFRMGKAVTGAEVTATDGGDEVLIPLNVVKTLIRDLKPMVKEMGPPATFSWSGEDESGFRTVQVERFSVVRFAQSFVLDANGQGFPKIGPLISKAFNEDPTNADLELRINPDLLGGFWAGIKAGVSAKAQREAGHPPLRFYGKTEHKPIGVAYGDWFVGLVMPVRLDSDRNERFTAAWMIGGLEPGATEAPAQPAEATSVAP